MTAIAYKDLVLAVDSKMSSGTMNAAVVEKILLPEKNETWWINGSKVLAIGLSGCFQNTFVVGLMLRQNLTSLTDLADYVNTGSFQLDFGLICILENGTSVEVDLFTAPGKHSHIAIGHPSLTATGGSGHVYITAGYAVGMSAVEAVELAIKIDHNSGGPVNTWTHPGVPKKLSKFTPVS